MWMFTTLSRFCATCSRAANGATLASTSARRSPEPAMSTSEANSHRGAQREGSPMSTEKIVHDEGAKLDLSSDMSYGDYLHLDEVLGAQHPRSPEHNEMLFIVQHQT